MKLKINRERIWEVLRERGETQTIIADRAGKSRQWINNILHSDNDNCTLETINVLADLLDINPRELI